MFIYNVVWKGDNTGKKNPSNQGNIKKKTELWNRSDRKLLASLQAFI